MRRFIVISAGLLTLFWQSSCTQLPTAELTAYSAAYQELEKITDDVLNIVTPYERIVIRSTAKTITTEVKDSGVATQPPANIDTSLLVSTPKKTKAVERQIVISKPCAGGYRGVAQFCYELRDAYADIGDPPVVGAYRHLSKVVDRFNAILTAYASGVSFQLIEQDLNSFSTAVTSISQNPMFAGAGGASSNIPLKRLVDQLLPLARLATDIGDRERLRHFLKSNHALVQEALTQMAINSPVLYSNVAIGTELLRKSKKGNAKALKDRRLDIRRLIANWTVILDDSRDLLNNLKFAIDNPNGLETRLRNLNLETSTTSAHLIIVRRQIAELGASAIK